MGGVFVLGQPVVFIVSIWGGDHNQLWVKIMRMTIVVKPLLRVCHSIMTWLQ